MYIDRPRGVVPRAKGCNLPANYAIKAENLNTQAGRFEPWRTPLELVQFEERVCSIHVRDCCWTGHSDPDTTYVDAGVDRKTYRSVPGERIMVTDEVCNPDWTCLGYPMPEPPVIGGDTGTTVTDGPDIESRTYRITYGTDCEEGPASCPSDPIKADKGSVVALLLPPPPETKWGATHVNIYRSVTTIDIEQGLVSFDPSAINSGFTDANSRQQYFLVDRIPVTAGSYVDTKEKLGRTLVNPYLFPPTEAAQLVGMTDLGSTVIYWENSIAFSERNKPWGFPLKTWHDFPFCVKDVKVCGNTVFVLTTGAVYVINDDIGCEDSSSRPVQELKGDNAPATCLSCVELPNGVLYTARTGLIRIGVDGSWNVVSRRAFEKDDWNQLGPIRSLTIGCGMVILRTDRESLLWEFAFDEQGNLPEDLTTLSFTAEDWVIDDQDHLYFLNDGKVYQFNAGDEYMSIDWWQAEQRTRDRQRISALFADYQDKKTPNENKVSVYREGCLSIQKSLGINPRKIRSTATDCLQVRVQGSEPMCALAYGQGFNNLRQV